MNRFVLLLVSLGIVLAALSGPSGAQPPSDRYAFSDTTLLRDTLDLKFDELFFLADSLQRSPETLRMLAIRYRMPLRRIAHLTDSLRVPPDSVGAIMEREQYNPLASTVVRSSAFSYQSTYSIGRQSATWGNGVKYDLRRGPLSIYNVTDISITTTEDEVSEEQFKTRASSTELGYRIRQNLSVGVRLNITGSQSFKPGSIYNISESSNQFDFSMRSRQQPSPNVSSELNFFGGPYNEPDNIPSKRGFGGTLTGRLTYSNQRWLTTDLNGQANGRIGSGRLPDRPAQSTQDFSRDLRGSVALFERSMVRMRAEFRNQHSELERPDTLSSGPAQEPLDYVRKQPTLNQSLDMTVSLQRGSNHQANVSQRFSATESQIAVAREGRFVNDVSTSEGNALSVDGRTQWRGWSLESRFQNGFPATEQPRRLVSSGATVYYRERLESHIRSIDATLRRSLSRRIVAQFGGGVALSSQTITNVDAAASTRTQDDYRQSYRIEGIYTPSVKANMRVKLEVLRTSNLFLQPTNSASTREDRTYRGEWTWTYRLLPGLTATQSNQMSSIQSRNPFSPDRNRLILDFTSTTTLNAVITEQLRLDLTHSFREAPSGQYTRAEDGYDYFSQSDEDKNYSLTGRISYSPGPALSLRLQPTYLSYERLGTVDGVESASTTRNSLTFSGGASVNLAVAARGTLTGSIDRNFQSSRQYRYPQGLRTADPLFEDDYWSGLLQFSWQL